MDNPKITTFESMVVWQEAQNLAVMVYEVTKVFPHDEIFGITSQIRRAATSVSANIAEGFGRSTLKDKLHFYTIAYGSLLETKNFLYLTQRLGYLSNVQLDDMLTQVVSCQKLINACKRSLR